MYQRLFHLEKAIEHLIDLINLKNKFGNIVIFIDKNFYTMNKELPLEISQKNIVLLSHDKEPSVNFIDNLKINIEKNLKIFL